MIKIMTAINNPILNEELKNEKRVVVICRDIQYKEGILEILEKEIEIDYIIINENLPGEIELKNLIEKILEKKEKIKKIIIIKKENKDKSKIDLNNEKVMTICYQNEINLNKLKNYNSLGKIKKRDKNEKQMNLKKYLKKYFQGKTINKINNIKLKIKKINIIKYYQNYIKNKNKNKNANTKIITVLGEEKVGKSMIIINFAYYLKNKNHKILIVELNDENSNFYTIFGCKKKNKIIRKKRQKIKNKCNKLKENFTLKIIKENIIKNMIIKINKNIDLISYNKLLNFYIVKKLANNYNYILIENYSKKNKIINKKIIKNSDKNILLIKPNLLGIKNSKKIIEKNNLNKIDNLKIIINNYNKNSINDKIIKKIFYENEIIGKIKYRIEFESLINNNLKNIKWIYIVLKKEIEAIINKII